MLVLVHNTCSVADGFNAVSYADNDGSEDWAGNWAEVGESTSASSGEIDVNSNRLRFDGVVGTDPYIIRAVNLSGATTATLTYDIFSSGNLEGGGSEEDRFKVMISSNGGSTWTQLKLYTNDINTSESFDITPYISANTMIRFGVDYGVTDWSEHYYVDNVQIDYDCTVIGGGGGGGSSTPLGTHTAIWSPTGTMKYNNWDGTAFTTTQNGSTQPNRWRVMAGASCPKRNEKLVIGVESGGSISGSLWNGTSWSNTNMTGLSTVGETFWWLVDVAYESQSGDAIIVGSGGSSNTIGYRVWNGTTWGAATAIAAYTGSEPKQMKLVCNPKSDEMILIVNDVNEVDYAMVWNGSSWGNAITLDNVNTQDRTDIYAAYESQSGQGLIVYEGPTSGPGIYYRTWNGSSWGAQTVLNAPSGPTGYTRWMVMASDKNSDRIVLGAQTSDPDGWACIWNGTAWETPVLLTASTDVLDEATAPNVAVEFEQSSGDALVTYGKSAQNTFYYRTWSSSAGWGSELTGTNVGDNTNSMRLYADPASNKVMLALQDNGSDLNFIQWDGSAWGTNNALETSSGETKNQPFVFLWSGYSSVGGGSGGGSSSLTATEDAMIYQASATTNYGGDTNFQVGDYSATGTQELRTVIKFDVSSLAGQSINSAILKLEVRSSSSPPVVINAHRLTTNWSESTVTWNSPWSTAGGNYDATTAGSATFTTPLSLGSPTETMSIDITSLVQNWASGTYPNYGLVLIDPSGSARSISAFSSEGTTPPKLEVSAGNVVDSLTFSQITSMCTDLEMPAGGVVQVKAYVSPANGTIPANPDISAILRHGATTFVSMSSPVYDSGAGTLTWTKILPSSYTLPAGDKVKLDINKNDIGYALNLHYDSKTKPSKIDLPTQTIIKVEELAVYDSAYVGGSAINGSENGKTVYVRTTVSDPFGPEDVTSLELTITAPSGLILVDTTLSDVNVAGTIDCNKIYEFAWTTGVEQGIYKIDVVAFEGYEGITDEASTTIEIQYDDFGTPCQVQFNDNSGNSTSSYDPNQQVCVQVIDIDENENPTVAETITAILSASSGDDEQITLTETGVNTGIFTACRNASSTVVGNDNNGTIYAPMGNLLTLSYSDLDLPTDECIETAVVNSTAPDVDIAIKLMEPNSGVAVVGEYIRFDITVSNPGNTDLTSLTLTNTFNAGQLTFTGASLQPSTTAAGSLTWIINVTIPQGESFTIETYFTGAAPANTAVSTASVSGVDVNSVAVSAGPVNDDVLITSPKVSVNKYLTAPSVGPYALGDTLTYKIDITNTGTTTVATLPLTDEFSTSCLQFVSAVPATDGAGGGVLLWNNLGSLNVGATKSVTTRFVIIGNCSPVVNTAIVSFAEDVNGKPVPRVEDDESIVTIAPPIAVDDVDTTGIATPVVTSVLLNDYDPNGNIKVNTIKTSGVLQPAHGVTSVNTVTGNITYTPQAGFSGVDTYEYIICDSTNLCDTALVTIYIFNEDCSNGIDDDGDGLIDCNDPDCSNFTNGGSIDGNESQCGPFDPTAIISLSLPSGGLGGGYEYRWESSVDAGLTWTLIPGAAGETYDPPVVSQTTAFRRGARRFACGNWVYSNAIQKATTLCPEICDNGLDDDGDGLTDCADTDCIPEAYAGSDVLICAGFPATLNASGTGGTQPYTFVWDNGLGEGESHTVSPTVTTIYRLMVETAGGCVAFDSVLVTVTVCTEICGDGIDNDGDGILDCDDPDCAAVGQPNLANDVYQTCPGVVFVEQPIFNDLNLQYPTYSIATNATKGNVTINFQGVFTYTPNLATCGVDSFQYQVCNTLTGCCDIATVVLNIGDNVSPALANVPADLTISCSDPVPPAPLVLGLDDCPGIFVTFDEVSTQVNAGSCDNYTIVRTWQATDKCGNSTSATQTITVEDTSPPELFRVYTLPNGKKLLAGIVQNGSTSWQRVKFPIGFSTTPLVFSQVVTKNGPEAVITRHRNIDYEGFELKLQEEEAANGVHALEQVAWMAIEAGTVSGTGDLQAGLLNNVNHSNKFLLYDPVFAAPPAFIASVQTYAEADPIQVRCSNSTAVSTQLKLEEEKSQDGETNHANETLAYLAVTAGNITDENGDFVALAGTVSMNNNWLTINFGKKMMKPVVLFGGQPTGNDPATIRVRNVTATSFEARIEEWDYLDGAMPSRTVAYFVVEGSVPATIENTCELTAATLIPGLNLFAVDNCDNQVSMDYTETSQVTPSGLVLTKTWIAADDCGNITNIMRNDTCNLAAVRLRGILHGSMIGNGTNAVNMRDNLRTKGYLPTDNPIDLGQANPIAGGTGGEVLSPAMMDIAGDSAVVDWVLVEIRDAIEPQTILLKAPCILRRNGDIVMVNGNSIIELMGLEEGNYHVRVKHRNHLGIMTESPVYLSIANPPMIDFTLPTTPVFGGTTGRKLENGKMMMWGGDYNTDDAIIYQGPNNDVFKLFTDVLTHPLNASNLANFIRSGYENSDINLDGNAIYQGPGNDRSMLLLNSILAHPTNSLLLANFIAYELLP